MSDLAISDECVVSVRSFKVYQENRAHIMEIEYYVLRPQIIDNKKRLGIYTTGTITKTLDLTDDDDSSIYEKIEDLRVFATKQLASFLTVSLDNDGNVI